MDKTDADDAGDGVIDSLVCPDRGLECCIPQSKVALAGLSPESAPGELGSTT